MAFKIPDCVVTGIAFCLVFFPQKEVCQNSKWSKNWQEITEQTFYQISFTDDV